MDAKLYADDEGPLTVACYVDQGQIVLNFGKPVHWLSLGPDDARNVIATLQQKIELLESGDGQSADTKAE